MNIKIRYLLFILFCFSANSLACSGNTGGSPNETVTFNNIFVQRDTPVGTVIASVYGSGTGDSHYWANNCEMYFIMKYYNAKLSNIADVYDTNIPGVGMRIHITTNHAGAYASPAPGSFVENLSNGGYWYYTPLVELFKTADIKSGKLATGVVATYAGKDNVNTGPDASVTWTLNSATSITQVACSITSGDSLSFPIGDVPANQFTSPGVTSQQTSTVNLGLNCDANANIHITLNGTQNPDSSNDSILTLSNQGQNGVAEGVGVQLIYNGTPLRLNNLLKLKTSAGGQESLPITARYIQTKSSVKAGSANATATLNLTYQ